VQEHPQNIYLVGLMGAGKTTIGKVLAKRLGWRFIDSDHEIEARTGVSIPTIFEIEGEAGFRRRESQVIEELTALRNIVMATGGGVVLAAKNRESLRQNGLVAYLDVSPDQLYDRTKRDKNRPLLQVQNPLRRLQELHSERAPLYKEVADVVIDGNRCNAQSVVLSIVKEYEKRCNP
jgi:shikimate kinase